MLDYRLINILLIIAVAATLVTIGGCDEAQQIVAQPPPDEPTTTVSFPDRGKDAEDWMWNNRVEDLSGNVNRDTGEWIATIELENLPYVWVNYDSSLVEILDKLATLDSPILPTYNVDKVFKLKVSEGKATFRLKYKGIEPADSVYVRFLADTAEPIVGDVEIPFVIAKDI